jgi:hypothetical protein
MHNAFRRHAVLAALLAASATSVLASGTTKDIVLDRVTVPASTPATPAANDAMAVSVLLESADGTLSPRSTDKMFRTGDRLRVKILASRDGKVAH